jgi:photosystem II stability/assembly factor-like uncharacterized protein
MSNQIKFQDYLTPKNIGISIFGIAILYVVIYFTVKKMYSEGAISLPEFSTTTPKTTPTTTIPTTTAMVTTTPVPITSPIRNIIFERGMTAIGTRLIRSHSSQLVVAFGTFFNDIMISKDFGLNWKSVSVPPVSTIHANISAVVADSTGNSIIVGKNDSTVLRSDNGGESFSPISNGFGERWIICVGSANLSVLVVGSNVINTTQINYYLYKNNAWKTLPVGSFTITIGCDDTGNTILYKGLNNNLCLSINGGSTWNNNNISENWMFCLCNFDGSVLYAGSVLNGPYRNNSRIYRSRDRGLNWEMIYEIDMYLFTLTIDRSGSRIAATFDQTYEYIYVSKDFGNNWTTISESYVKKINSTNKWSPTLFNPEGNKIMSFNLSLAPIVGKIFPI